MGIMYVGRFGKVTARWPEHGITIAFQRAIPRFLPRKLANLFEPNADWVVGVNDGVHDVETKGKTHKVLVRRRVALGDVITVHGALQGVSAAYPDKYEFIYQVEDIYQDVFSPHPFYFAVLNANVSVERVKCDYFINLDGLLERDHHVDEEKISRVDRTWKHFFMARPELRDNPDLKPIWDLTIPETNRAWAYKELHSRGVLKAKEEGKPIVAVASRAIQKPRNIKDGLVKRFTRELVKRTGAKVILIEHDDSHIWRGEGIEGFPKSNVLEAMALMQHCDVLCTMDSGAMWMGHCIPIPMVVWFGPTPPETKINYHPYYPEGCRPLLMWEWVNCENRDLPCYEAAKWCDFSYKCMKDPPPDRFVEDTITAVMELVEWKRGQKADQEEDAPGA